MKFKILRTSGTGKKLVEIEKKRSQGFKETKALAKEIGFFSWRGAYWTSFGGISSVNWKDRKNPDPKLWKKQDDGFYPKKNSKQGKELAMRLEALTMVSDVELGESVGFFGAPWKTIGINFGNEEWFGIEVGDDWEYEPPSDCIEITVSEYNSLFP